MKTTSAATTQTTACVSKVQFVLHFNAGVHYSDIIIFSLSFSTPEPSGLTAISDVQKIEKNFAVESESLS